MRRRERPEDGDPLECGPLHGFPDVLHASANGGSVREKEKEVKKNADLSTAFRTCFMPLQAKGMSDEECRAIGENKQALKVLRMEPHA